MKSSNKKYFCSLFLHNYLGIIFILILVTSSLPSNVEDSPDSNEDREKVDDNEDIFQYQQLARTELGMPYKISSKLNIYTITSTINRQTINKCLLINAGSFLSPKSVQSANLMRESVSKIIILNNNEDISAEKFIRMHFKDSLQKQANVNLDSHYLILNKKLKPCQKVLYLQSHFQIINPEYTSQLLSGLQPLTARFSIFSQINSKQTQLRDLNQTDLQLIKPLQLTTYIFVFDPIFLNILTPLNFAFYNKYTIDEIIIYPLVVLLQSSDRLLPIEKTVHKFDLAIIQANLYEIQQISSYQEDTFCFVSLPNNCLLPSLNQTDQYIEHLISNSDTNGHGLVMYAPYSFQNSLNSNSNLFRIGLSLLYYQKFFSFTRLRIRANKTVSSLAAYQSAYTYCPKKSLLVISRQNIKYSSFFISEVQANLALKYNYYLTYLIDNQNLVTLNYHDLRRSATSFRSQAYLYDVLKHVQIIKSDFFRSIYLWILKSQEIDFYQAEASYIYPLLEYVRFQVSIIPKPLIKIEPRFATQKQEKEIQNIKLYYVWPLSDQQRNVYPYKYNALSNKAFKREAKPIIPKKIHQIWLGKKQISPMRKKLQKTIREKNIDYQYKLWRQKDVTKENFPITYSLIHRIKEYQEYQERSLGALMADLLRLQILLRNGGIYLDFKTQGLKPLDPFLKYQIFFIDMDYTKRGYGNPRFIGNTYIGCIPNNYYINYILTQIILEENVDPTSQKLPVMTGAIPLRRSFNIKELFHIPGFGFHLFSQYPNNDQPLRCSNPQNYWDDQELFALKSLVSNKIYKVGIPCRQYQQSYLVMYKQLGRSWHKVEKPILSHRTSS